MLRPPPQPFIQVNSEEELVQLGEFLRKQAHDYPATPLTMAADANSPKGIFNNPSFVGVRMLYQGMVFSIKLTLDDAGSIRLLHLSMIRLVENDMSIQQVPVEEKMGEHIARVFLDVDVSDQTKVPRMITSAKVRHFMLPRIHPNAILVAGEDVAAVADLANAMRSAALKNKVDKEPGKLTLEEAIAEAKAKGGSMLDQGVVRIVSFGDEKVTTILTLDTFESPARWHLSLSCTAMLTGSDTVLVSDLPPLVSESAAVCLAQAILGDNYAEVQMQSAMPNVRHFVVPYQDEPAA